MGFGQGGASRLYHHMHRMGGALYVDHNKLSAALYVLEMQKQVDCASPGEPNTLTVQFLGAW